MSNSTLAVWSVRSKGVKETRHKTVEEAVSAAADGLDSGKFTASKDRCVVYRDAKFPLLFLAYWDHETGAGIFARDENGEFMNKVESEHGTCVRAVWTIDGEELSETLAHLETSPAKDREEEISTGEFECAGTDIFRLIERMTEVISRQSCMDVADDFYERLCFGRSIHQY